MATYRTVQTNFWTDINVVDNFTPEDRYFYLYLMTNPHTNLAGCYEISKKTIADETGYAKETVERLLDRMEKSHNVIRMSPTTKEILILRWFKYNWTQSPLFRKALAECVNHVKDSEFREYLNSLYNGIDTVSIPYTYRTDTSVTVYIDNNIKSISDTNTDNKYSNNIKDIIDYLNIKIGARYKYSSEKTNKHIRARLDDGFTVEDFKTVIDKKCAEWVGTEWEKFLRPETLFGTKFEGYLNQMSASKKKSSGTQSSLEEWAEKMKRERGEQ